MPLANGPDVSGFLDKLDLVGKNPLTYVAFLMLILGWVGAWYFFHKRVYPRILEKIRHDQRYSALQLLVLGLPDNITDNRLKILRWRYLIVAYGMTLVVFLILAGLFAYYWTRPEEKSSAEVVDALADQGNRLRRIEESTVNLRKLQLERQALILNVVALRKTFASSASLEIRSKAEELQKLIDEFLTKFDRESLPEPAQRQLAMAEAEAAFARGEFKNSLDLVDPKGSELLIRQGTDALAEGVTGMRLRARSHFQMRQWKDAAAGYTTILDTPLGNEQDRIMLAFCYDSDGQEEKALELYEQAIRTLSARGPNRSEKEDTSLGDVYFSRAMVWKRRNEAARAAADYKEAASAFDGDRLTPLFQKEFPALGLCAQQFFVAQCCTARLSALNTAKAPTPDLTDAAAEAVLR